MERWELPQGWGWKKLEYKNKIFAGGPAPQKSEYYVNGQYPFVRVSDLGAMKRTDNLNTIRDYLNEQAIYDLHLVKAQRNTILFPKSGAAILTNNRALLGIDAFIVSHLAAVTPDMGFWNPKWVYYWMCTIDLKDFLQNPSYPSLKLETIRKIPIPLPYPDDPAHSLAEQRRIVARLEALLGEVRALREEVQSIRRDLAQVMESALTEAFNLDEKTPKWSIATIANVKGGKRLPKGETFAEGITPYPYIRVTDFQDFSVRIENLHYLKPETYQKIRRYTISKDDVYISIAGTIGLVGIIPERLDGANLTENAAKIVFRSEYRGKIIPKYLVYFLVSPDGKKQIEERSKAAGQPKLALERIETIEIPEVDVSEQRRIVAYLERIAEETRAMDDLLAQDLRDLDALEQSILAAAFRGEV